MERKIGEIFEHNGEWYQCVIGGDCRDCAFNNDNCEERKRITLKNKLTKEEVTGLCTSELRSDGKSAIFKKLEKVGEPYERYIGSNKSIKVQRYRLPYRYAILPKEPFMILEPNYKNSIEIGIKQNKEDMEEKKLIELLSEKVHNAWMKEKEVQGFSYGKDYDKEKKKHPDMLPYNELKEEVKEYDRATVRAVLQAQKEMQSKYNYNTLKSFDIEAAKSGKPVCTRDGHKARIICFDKKGAYPIVALVNDYNEEEYIKNYDEFGKKIIGRETGDDLMMLPKKKDRWVNIYRNEKGEYWSEQILFSTKKDATDFVHNHAQYVTTVKIEWEE